MRDPMQSACAAINSRRDFVVAGYTALSAPPKPGTTVMHLSMPDCRLSMRTVLIVRDHRPVDGTPTKDAIVEFHDGDWDYWWNLYEGD